MAAQDSFILPDTAAFISPLAAVHIIRGTCIVDSKLENITGVGDTQLKMQEGGFTIVTGQLHVIGGLTRGSAYSVALSAITWAAGVATITHTAVSGGAFVVGDMVNIVDVVPSPFNGAYAIDTVTDTTHIKVNMASSPEPPAYVSGGSVRMIGPGWKVINGRLSFATDAGEHMDSGDQGCYLLRKTGRFLYGSEENKKIPMVVDYMFSEPAITVGAAPATT